MSPRSLTVADPVSSDPGRTAPLGRAAGAGSAAGGRAAGETVAVVGRGAAAREAARLLRAETAHGVVSLPALPPEGAAEQLVGASVVVLEAAGGDGREAEATAQWDLLSRVSPGAAAIVLVEEGARWPHFEGMGPQRPRVVAAPVTRESLLTALDAALSYRNLLRENRALRGELRTAALLRDWVGSSPAAATIRAAIFTAAFSETPAFLLGERGAGRRLAAELIHRLSRRSAFAFVPLDAASLPAGELGAVFADLRRAVASGSADPGGGPTAGLTVGSNPGPGEGPPGSVYLRGVGRLKAADQVALEDALRRPPPFRLLCSADPGIAARAREGSFSPRLLRKLETLTVRLAPLRERQGDVPELIVHFLSQAGRAAGVGPFGLSPAAMQALSAYRWPGNAAELKSRVGRAVAMAAGSRFEGPVLPDSLCPLPGGGAPEIPAGTETRPLKAVVTEFEKSLIERALRRCEGNQKRAAGVLQVNPTTLHEKMKRMGLLRRPAVS